MIVMEGLMLVPPDRGTIIGRALWKTRYVTLGTGAQPRAHPDVLSHSESRSARKGLKYSSSKPSLMDDTHDVAQGLFLSIYRAKGDWELVAQYHISSFKSCEIRNVQYRKQAPSLPTMMLEFHTDAATERVRKRRSSRTGGLSSSKDPWASTVLFRTVPEERYNIYDWQITVKPQLVPESQESLTEEFESALSPVSPVFNSFINPFATRDTRTPTSISRPDFLSRGSSQSIQPQGHNNYPHAPKERPSAMMSPSPSLRSRRSDLSSRESSMMPSKGFTASQLQTNYAVIHSPDIPSPASTSGYDTQYIEGWTSAQGRTSTLSSHTRGSNSIASAIAPAAPVGATPPGPRETILDRAFQMRCIPGSERALDKDEEKISSIARFEALMREADEQKQQAAIDTMQKSGFRKMELEEESEESSADEGIVEEDEDDLLGMSDQDSAISTPAQRALDYISGRRRPHHVPRSISPMPKSASLPFLNPQALPTFHATPSLVTSNRPNSLALPQRSISAAAVSTLRSPHSESSKKADADTSNFRRRSSTSVKRLSFTEFAKRLSSTSSLLLVQTNASSNSGREGSMRTSSEYGSADDPNAVGLKDKHCGWRGSVGAFGGEGGFL